MPDQIANLTEEEQLERIGGFVKVFQYMDHARKIVAELKDWVIGNNIKDDELSTAISNIESSINTTETVIGENNLTALVIANDKLKLAVSQVQSPIERLNQWTAKLYTRDEYLQKLGFIISEPETDVVQTETQDGDADNTFFNPTFLVAACALMILAVLAYQYRNSLSNKINSLTDGIKSRLTHFGLQTNERTAYLPLSKDKKSQDSVSDTPAEAADSKSEKETESDEEHTELRRRAPSRS